MLKWTIQGMPVPEALEVAQSAYHQAKGIVPASVPGMNCRTCRNCHIGSIDGHGALCRAQGELDGYGFAWFPLEHMVCDQYDFGVPGFMIQAHWVAGVFAKSWAQRERLVEVLANAETAPELKQEVVSWLAQPFLPPE